MPTPLNYTFIQIWLNLYLRLRRAMDALAQRKDPWYGARYAFLRGLLLGILVRILYLPLAMVFIRT